MVAAMVQGSEVLTLLWRYPDPKGPVGKLLDRQKRLALMRAVATRRPSRGPR